jgi:flagellar basal body-associated protein FliL
MKRKRRKHIEIGETNDRIWPFILIIVMLFVWLFAGVGLMLWQFSSSLG